MNSAPALPYHRLLEWLGRVLAVTLLGLLLVGLYGWWVIARLDTKNLPPRHGQVDTRLFAVEGESRPLIVGLGGAEGGMANMMMQRLQTHAFSHIAEHTAMPGGHTAVLDAFPQIEAFLQANFAPDGSACNIQAPARLAVDY